MRSLIFSLPLALIVLSHGGIDRRSSCDGGSLSVSPYSAAERVTAPLVAANRARAAQNVTASCGEFGISEARILPDGVHGGVEIVGRTPQKALVRLSLASVERATVLDPRAADGHVLLEVRLFPTISPEALVATQPTFTKLDGGFRKTARLLIDRRCKLAGTGEDATGGKLKKGVVLRDLPKGSEILFHLRSLWWAIPSVTDDPKYPFRARAD